MALNKYQLYEASVQSPRSTAEWFVSIYKTVRGRYPVFLREDFCGTFLESCEWVRRNYRNRALSLDLDPEPLAYGRKNHLKNLTASQRKRIQVVRQNVLEPSRQKVDLIVACNFSFYIFKKRQELVSYFQATLKSLARGKGILILEMAGGPGMIERVRESKTVRPSGRKNGAKVTYVWDQKSFNPITRDAKYAIHFKMPGKPALKNVFTYDWRLWTIPEVRDALEEAGYSRSVVFWETEHKGEGTGEYVATEEGDNAFSWIAYIVGVK